MDHSGWLEKKSGGKQDGRLHLGNALNKWERRFFSLDEEGVLSYYRSPSDTAPAGTMDCNGGALEQHDGCVLSVHSIKGRVLTLRAADDDDCIGWVCALAAFVDGGAARGAQRALGSQLPAAPPAPPPQPCAPFGAGRSLGGSAAQREDDRSALGLGPKSSAGPKATSGSGAGGSSSASGVSNPFGEGGGEGGGEGEESAGRTRVVDFSQGPYAASKYVANLRQGGLKDDEELQAIQQEVAQHETQIDESTKRMLQMATAARDTGSAMLEQLDSQGKQMNRIQVDQAKVQVNLDTTNRMLKGMNSFMGWRAWGQRAEPKQPRTDAISAELKSAAATVDAANRAGSGLLRGAPSAPSAPSSSGGVGAGLTGADPEVNGASR